MLARNWAWNKCLARQRGNEERPLVLRELPFAWKCFPRSLGGLSGDSLSNLKLLILAPLRSSRPIHYFSPDKYLLGWATITSPIKSSIFTKSKVCSVKRQLWSLAADLTRLKSWVDWAILALSTPPLDLLLSWKKPLDWKLARSDSLLANSFVFF